MDIKDIKAIYKFFRGTDLEEIEVEEAGSKVRMKRAGLARRQVEVVYDAPDEAPSAAEAPKEAKAAPAAVNENVKTVNSPMVGTFYRAPSPDAQPFVEVGSVIKPGQAVCIIEAMKLMNEVESELGGKILSVLVENGQPVEYGEPLFTIEVSK
jgi:acetyl-CoA carboxylase biotin carboxyl carrier protein